MDHLKRQGKENDCSSHPSANWPAHVSVEMCRPVVLLMKQSPVTPLVGAAAQQQKRLKAQAAGTPERSSCKEAPRLNTNSPGLLQTHPQGLCFFPQPRLFQA